MNSTFMTKAVRVVGAVLLGPVLGLAGAPFAFADNDGSQTAALEKSIVFLQTDWTGFIEVPPSADAEGNGYWTDKLTYSVTCTGFYVSKSADIVTAGHCVDPAEGRQVIIDGYLHDQNAKDMTDQAYANWVVEGDQKGEPVQRTMRAIQPNGVDGATITSATTVQVVDFKATDAGDVALLHLPNMNKETPGLVIAEKAPQVGDQVTSIGFPGDIQDIADQSQIARASFKSGTVSSDQVTPTGVTQIEVSTELAPGMSGGPTVNKDNRVVGVNSSGLTTQAGFNFVTYTPDLRSFLQSHNIPLVQPPAPARGGPALMWIVIGAAVALAAVAALLFALLRGRRTPQLAGSPTGGYPIQNAGQFPGQAPWGAPPATGQPGSVNPAAPAAPPYPSTAAADYSAATTAPASGPIATGGSDHTDADTGTGQAAAVGNFCPSCGAAHHADEHFCPQCGKQMN